MPLSEIRIEVPASQVDAIDDVLLERGDDRWSLLEDAINRRAWLVGIFLSESEARQSQESLAALLPGTALGEIEVRALADGDWRDSYKAHFHAWQFGNLHWVPVWEREQFVLPSGHAVLWLDPGLAFGTGNHETTRLCVERLVTLAQEKGTTGPVIDAGCGSGILALSAALLGYSEVSGFDNDPEAMRVSVENAAFNGLERRVSFSTGDLVSGFSGRQAHVVLANIQADVLMKYVRELVAAVAPGGALVLSGILAAENAAVRTAFSAAVPTWPMEHRVMGEWSDVLLTRPLAP